MRIIYSNMENLVFRARSEMIGTTSDQICFLVSGVGFQKIVLIMGVQNIPGSRFPELNGRSENEWLS